MKEIIIAKYIYTSLFLCVFIYTTHAQTSINVIQSNTLNQLIKNDTLFHKFSGNVIIEYSDLKIRCDTILIDQNKNNMLGWGNAKIHNDTLNCSSDSIKINQRNKHLYFYQNSLIKINDMLITSDYIEYDYKNNTLQYLYGGDVQQKSNHIESQKLIYNLNTNSSHFANNIQLTTTEYIIKTETMNYKQDLINFSGYTLIENSDFHITCNKGSFRKGVFLKISNNVILKLEKETIQADFLDKDLVNDKNLFKNNIQIKLDENTTATGNLLVQFDHQSELTDECKMYINNLDDSISITGDKIIMNNKIKDVKIINNVIISGNTIDGICKQVQYESSNQKITMSNKPIMWFDDIQVTGEEIVLYTHRNQLDSIYIPKQPFIIAPHDSLQYYDQIKGLVLEGKFQNNVIDYIQLKGNSHMKNFDIVHDSLIKINNVTSSKILLSIDTNKIKNVSCFNQIEANQIEINNMQKDQNINKLLYFSDFKLINKPF